MVLGLTTLFLSLVAAVAVVLAGDIYLHYKYQDVAGLNVWGYRGPVVGSKQPGERRIVFLGGSTIFGYGVRRWEALPARLEQQLSSNRPQGGGAVSVVNLAYNAEGAYSFVYTLRDYAYLDFDMVILASGYNDLQSNTSVVRHQSPVFRLTGYWPIFPLILQEKAMALRYGGDIGQAYRGEKTTFVPKWRDRTVAEGLEASVQVSRSLEHQLGRLTDADRVEKEVGTALCSEQWAFYCERVYSAVNLALQTGKLVVVVTEPYISDQHVEQQKEMSNMLRQRFQSPLDVAYVNLGRVVDLKDPTLAWDRMHLSVTGNERMAAALAKPVLDALEKAGRH